MAARLCDKRLEVTDAAAVPSRFKRAVVTLPLELWETLLDAIDLDLRDQAMSVAKVSHEVNTSGAKAALKAGEDIPGAQLAGGRIWYARSIMLAII